MKMLHLLRHAKSDHDPHMKDHERPLAKRGVKAANLMADHMKAMGLRVDHVYCSTARRTRDTYDLVKSAFGAAPVKFRDNLYLIEPGSFIDFIHDLPESVHAPVVIGHDPTFHITARELISEAAPGKTEELAALHEKFPTGALCSLRFDVSSWRAVKSHTGQCVGFVRPRDLE